MVMSIHQSRRHHTAACIHDFPGGRQPLPNGGNLAAPDQHIRPGQFGAGVVHRQQMVSIPDQDFTVRHCHTPYSPLRSECDTARQKRAKDSGRCPLIARRYRSIKRHVPQDFQCGGMLFRPCGGQNPPALMRRTALPIGDNPTRRLNHRNRGLNVIIA